MELRRYKDVVAIQSGKHVWGFHAHNMELAELTPELWSALETEATLQQNQQLLSEIESWHNEKSSDTHDALDSQQIKKLSLNVVQICNLRCTYCAAGGDGTYGSPTKKLDLSIAEKQIQHFLNSFEPGAENEPFQIHYLGGEPLLHPHIIRQLSHYAKLCVAGTKKEVAFSITTNGTLITPAIAEMLAEFQFSVIVSIDGDAATNDIARPTVSKNQSSTELTLRGLKELSQVRERLRALSVNSVFGEHNLKIVECYEFLMSLHSDWSEINFLYANNQPDKDEQVTKEYIEKMNQVAHMAFTRNGLAGLAQVKQFQSVLMRLAAQTRIHSYCGAGKSLLQVDTKGDVYACNWFMNDVSEKMGAGIDIDQNKKLELAPSLIELNKCESCWARHFCGGGCMYVHKTKTGLRHGKDLQFCKRTRALGATAIHYYGLSQIAD